jgi:hypothetical protein
VTATASPTLSGLHHVKIPDHFDSDGARYAAILNIPGVPVAVELRWAPVWARAPRECDIVVPAVDSADQLDVWLGHLDANRVMVSPRGEVAAQTLPSERLEPEGPWLNPAPMRHPRTT